MGATVSKLNCNKNKSKERGQVNPEELEKKRFGLGRRSSLRELVKDLNSFWKNSDSSTRSKSVRIYSCL